MRPKPPVPFDRASERSPIQALAGRPMRASHRLVTSALVVASLCAGATAGEAQTGAQSPADPCVGDPSQVLARAAPEDVGLSSAVLARLVADLREKDRDIHGLIVSRRCRVAVELYAQGVGREHNHAIYSVTKSVMATLVGALLHQGKLASVDTPVAELMTRPAAIPPASWEKLGRIRLAHVLSMSSGLEYKHEPTRHPIYRAPSRLAHALEASARHEPGRHFQYSDGDASIAGAVVAARAGRDLRALAEAALFRPLDFRNTDWWFVDQMGLHPGGWGMRLRVVDMVKLGYLWLQRGNWRGHRVFAADFVDRAWAETAVPHYGLYWWRNRRHEATLGTLRIAVGFKGQRVFLSPRHGLVVAVTANLARGDEGPVDDLVMARLAEALEAGAGNGDPAGAKVLAEELARPFAGKPEIVAAQDTPRPPPAGQRP